MKYARIRHQMDFSFSFHKTKQKVKRHLKLFSITCCTNFLLCGHIVLFILPFSDVKCSWVHTSINKSVLNLIKTNILNLFPFVYLPLCLSLSLRSLFSTLFIIISLLFVINRYRHLQIHIRPCPWSKSSVHRGFYSVSRITFWIHTRLFAHLMH